MIRLDKEVEKMESIRAAFAILVISGIFGLNTVPVRACAGSVREDIPITDYDPSDDIHGDTLRFRTEVLQRVGEKREK